MTQPSVTLTELGNSLGILPSSAGELLVVIGTAQQGPVAQIGTYGSVKDLTDVFGAGPGPEAAAFAISTYGRPVVFLRVADQADSSVGAIYADTIAGTSVVTTDGAATSYDNYQAYMVIVTGGTVGTTGIELRYSLDNGRTLSPLQSLGTATSYTIPGSGGITFDFAAGTLVAGDEWRALATAPTWVAGDLDDCIAALQGSPITYGIVLFAGTITPTQFTAIEADFTGLKNAHINKMYVANTRQLILGDTNETEAEYLTAMTSSWGSLSSTNGRGAICASSLWTTSAISGRLYQWPLAMSATPFINSLSRETNAAQRVFGTIPGTQLRDDNGNQVPGNHDESLNPGLDDLRLLTARSWKLQGPYVNRPLLFSPAGNDFDVISKRRVINLIEDDLYSYLIDRLNSTPLVDPDTGFLADSELNDIAAGGTYAMGANTLNVPMVSSVAFVPNTTDKILVTKTLTGEARIVPLGLIEHITVNISYVNPALAGG